MELTSIGHICSPYQKRADCPKQGHEQGFKAEIVIKDEYLPAMKGLSPGQELLILTWLDQGHRALLECHPRGDSRVPKKGVFATRSPDRPNPIGLHRVRLLEFTANRLSVYPLEVIDQTSVIDIKPVLDRVQAAAWGPGISAEDGELLRQIGRAGWEKGLLSGFNGNLSLRRQEHMIITAAGRVKGRLEPGDLVCVDLATGQPCAKTGMSSETPLHLAIYRFQPQAGAIVHSHPVHLLALDLLSKGSPLDLPLFETDVLQNLFAMVDPIQPGSEELARIVADAARDKRAIFMRQHGLVCWAENVSGALALSEEIESLARIKLKVCCQLAGTRIEMRR